MSDPSSLFSVAGRVALISGASSGIGSYIAHGLADHSCARVYIVGRRTAQLQSVASYNPKVLIPIEGDVSTKNGCLKIAETFERLEREKSGVKDGEKVGLDILVCNAGVAILEGAWDHFKASPEEVKNALLKLDDEDWATEFAINASAIQWLSAALLPSLAHASQTNSGFRQGRGAIITNTSVSAIYVSPHAQGHLYCASKAAAETITHNLASKFTKHGVRVNSLAIANIPSEMNDPNNENSFISKMKDIMPIGRIGTEEDAVGAVVYLSSRAGSYVSGTTIKLDGGALIGI
ncbi:hypothetical protein JAAARDRAFT_39309 [Jaapia argillacea MUCL 33604]|uniref:Ketoreductase (KR) domain-containing protein n=1 Tax=Jaapia argillacea MUCL 33604 TaxID=933084 RepID=A0A067PFR7_9AGAM|nr:hypothetical protein JAAARDRAFT_39309 [Jaapia argillacea MUCL 33604]